MIIRAAVVPHPPLLVPELVGRVTTETEPVRSASVAAARQLSQVSDVWVAVAADISGPASVPSSAGGSFLGFGVDVPVSLAAPATPPVTGAPSDLSGAVRVDPQLPLPLLVAGWLRERAGARDVRAELVHPDLPTPDCRARGAALAQRLSGPDPVGLLVLGDGSNRHTERAPARPDDRAEGFDEAVRAALAAADPAALLALDAGLAAELGAVGRAAWQVLAGVAEAVGGAWRGEVTYSAAPFGVAYHVAVWEPAASAT